MIKYGDPKYEEIISYKLYAVSLGTSTTQRILLSDSELEFLYQGVEEDIPAQVPTPHGKGVCLTTQSAPLPSYGRICIQDPSHHQQHSY